MESAFPSKRIKRYLLTIGFIFLANIQPFKAVFVFFVEPFFTSLDYATPSGGFRDDEIPLMHRNYEDLSRRFNHYKQEHPADTVLYRLYRINPIMFWEWGDMLTKPKYRLPYLNPNNFAANDKQ